MHSLTVTTKSMSWMMGVGICLRYGTEWVLVGIPPAMVRSEKRSDEAIAPRTAATSAPRTATPDSFVLALPRLIRDGDDCVHLGITS